MRLRMQLSGSFLRSRIALRIFLLCAICSLVPTLLIGVVVYTRIASAEVAAAHERLQDHAKRYGVLLQERLYDAERELLEAAQRELSGERADDPQDGSGRVAEVSVLPVANVGAGAPANLSHPDSSLRVLEEALRAVQRAGQSTAALSLLVADAQGNALRVSGVVVPDYLWASDVVDSAGMSLCVFVLTQQLACRGDADARVAGGENLRADWELYMRPHYGVEGWTIRVQQPRRLSEIGLASVRRMFPVLAGIALLTALLISSVEVRRAHRPLVELLAGIRGMTRGRYVRVGFERRRDEYASIGRAFNSLSRKLRRQLHLLSGLARMDLAILNRPGLNDLVHVMLPRLPPILDCRAVALCIVDADGKPVLQVAALRNSAALHALPLESRDIGGQLGQLCPGLRWDAVPIRSHGRERGQLWVGRKQPRASSSVLRRQARGVARRFAVALRHEEREQLLLQQAYYDELSGLPNRRLLQDRVQQILREAQSDGSKVAFLYLDLDRFKTLNDSLGHRAGDTLLAMISRSLSGSVGVRDTVARLGGDEFVVLLARTTTAETAAAAARILALVQKPVVIEGVVIVPQTSIGIAMYPQDGTNFDTLLRNADAAMYRGKAAGGGRTVFFEESMNEQALRRLRLESGLRRALQAGALRLCYQPKIFLRDGALRGVEALLRWEDPELGVVSPTEFIPVAEDSGLIHEVGRFALQRAMDFARHCMDAGVAVGHVAVNVSMLQLRDADLVDFLAHQLRQRCLPPGMLQIEVTESAIMEDAMQVSRVLERVRALGVRVAIDDFGTGYSSLAVLQQLQVDMLKIDRVFVAGIATSTQGLELVRAMLAVARALDLQTVAEGVENAAQARLLAENGCDCVQGFLYSEALDDVDMMQAIRDWQSVAAIDLTSRWRSLAG